MSKVLIAGGTGLVGRRLTKLLEEKGYEVLLLSRKKNHDVTPPRYSWDLQKKYIDNTLPQEIDYVINLAGAGIADNRWSKSRKEILIESRTQGAATFHKYFREGNIKPKAYISSSAVGYYGTRGDEVLTEESKSGTGFLAECTIAWEKSIEPIAESGIRTVALRTGIVLSDEGGALEKIMIPFKMGMGNWFGNGGQWYPWIHIDDICRMYIFAMENEEINGIYNAAAPNPITNKELTYAIKEVKGKPYLMMPVPEFTMKLAMGEMSDVVLSSTRTSVDKILKTGFQFDYPEVKGALQNIFQ